MSKEPVPGKVKTRLTPPLSPDEGARLYDCFLRDRLNEMSMISNIDKAIAYTPKQADGVFKRYASDNYAVFPQRGRHLGERMHHIFADHFKKGYKFVVVIGCDSPDLPKSIVIQAFDILKSNRIDVVLGPATDGGYYLIGMKKAFPGLFTGIAWGSDTVLSATLQKAERLGIKAKLLSYWSDIDTYEDLIAFYNKFKEPSPHQRQIADNTIMYLRHIKALGYI